MKTRCLIVDDEPLARGLIRNHLAKLQGFEVIAECSDAVIALETLQRHQVDLMFMDIQMPQITGIELLKTLKHPPQVIITTAYRDYAIEGFELDVVDYLLKPITFSRFLKAVNKYFQISEKETQSINSVPTAVEEPYIYVKENKRMVRLLVNSILYIEGLNEYVKIHTTDKKIVTKTSMSVLEEMLPDQKFLRVHKSYIVALRKIEAFTATWIELGGKELPIGRSYKNKVAEALHNDSITAN